MKSKIGLRLVFFLTVAILLFTGATDADLFDNETVAGNMFSATTLDFANKQTSNELTLSFLFNASGLIPGGFEVKSLRVKKEGEMDFHYRLTVAKTAGDDNLYQALTLTLVQNWQIVYQGGLDGLSLDDLINENGLDDWILAISLSDNNQALALKECEFNLVVKTWKDDPGENWGFVDEEILSNRISTGSWAN